MASASARLAAVVTVCLASACLPAEFRTTYGQDGAGGGMDVLDATPPPDATPDAMPDALAPDAAPEAGTDASRPCGDAGECPVSLTCCGGACVDLRADPAHCSACGTVCPSGDHARPACNASACALRCDDGWGDCDGLATNGCETDLRDNAAHCGACGNACPLGCEGTACVRVAELAAGETVSCARSTDGRVRCWGGNDSLQAGGNASRDFVDRPGLLTDVRDAQQIALHSGHGCVLRTGGTVSCWGAGYTGQLGNDDVNNAWSTPVAVQNLARVTRVAVGTFHSCAVLVDGSARCWGYNQEGELGDGTTMRRTLPVEVFGLRGIQALALGRAFTCSLMTAGTVRCWGRNDEGQLGDGTTTPRAMPAEVPMLNGVSEIVAGDATVCVRRMGAVLCWGAGAAGQLGTPGLGQSTSPVAVPGISDATRITGSADTFCALRASGEAVCWGVNDAAQLGERATDAGGPTVATLPAPADQIAAGKTHVCALLRDGRVRCWGRNNEGQLGDGTAERQTEALPVEGLTRITTVAAGARHTCALRADGVALCWGVMQVGSQPAPVTFPQLVPSTARLERIVSGYDFSCARTSGGTPVVSCWGANDWSTLGDGGAMSRSSAAAVTGTNYQAGELGAGVHHACFVDTRTGAPSCWGRNGSGQAVPGNSAGIVMVPTTLALTGAAEVVGGAWHGCARLSSGAVSCWGDASEGQIFGLATAPVTPTMRVFMPAVAQLASGASHVCARLQDGTAQCWGRNDEGQAGTGSVSSTTPPVSVQGLGTIVDIGAGTAFSCARLADGVVQCWGAGAEGQIGDGSTSARLRPTSVRGVIGAVGLTVGGTHACVLMPDQTVRCWGATSYGQTGHWRGDVKW